MSDEEDAKFEPEFKPEDPKLFDMNRIVRLGRSRDQVNSFVQSLESQVSSYTWQLEHIFLLCKCVLAGWQIEYLVYRAKDGCGRRVWG